MATAIDLTSAAAGDDILTWANTLVAELEAVLVSIPGDNVQSATIANAALANNKAFFGVAVELQDVTTTSVAGVAMVILPNLSGSSATFTFLGASITFGQDTDVIAPQSGSQLLFKGYNGSSHAVLWTETAVLSSANISVTPMRPYDFVSTAQDIVSGNYVRVDYTGVASADFKNGKLVLWFKVKHVS